MWIRSGSNSEDVMKVHISLSTCKASMESQSNPFVWSVASRTFYRQILSLLYRSFSLLKLPPPACPGTTCNNNWSIYLTIHLPIYLPIYQSIYRSINRSSSPSIAYLRLYEMTYVNLNTYVHINISIYISIYIYIYLLFMCFNVYIYI